ALRRRRVGSGAPRGPASPPPQVRAVSFRDRLYERARRAHRSIVLTEGDDARVREAAQRLTANGLGVVELLGDVGRDPRATDCAGLLRAPPAASWATSRWSRSPPTAPRAAPQGRASSDCAVRSRSWPRAAPLPISRSTASSRATPRSWPTSPVARPPDRRWRAAPTCSC